ncbi:uncharacterized protein LOC142683581 [Rhinoderma darwinii]|uniref:uncharacterized protein LOC142683581 n=1 Tax=Rhinoderma darwinii TaxID=43563 RepID=UPI003F673DB2
MEPPPGPCSSPPGPRPVPPPRKGSMERRPLSPLRKEGENLGGWDASSDVSVQGSKPGTPERVTVTQRVLIVMQSHGSPTPAAVTSQGPSALENTPMTNWGASPPPRTSEITPITNWGASPPPKTSEITPITNWGASPPPKTSEITPITNWGASPPPKTSEESQETAEITPITNWGASPPPRTYKEGQETSEITPIINLGGASPPPRTSEITPITNWGASPPPRTYKEGQETSEITQITNWGASLPPRTSEITPITNWRASLPPRTSEEGQETAAITPITNWRASLPSRTYKEGQEMAEITPITGAGRFLPEPLSFQGHTQIQSTPKENLRVSLPENIPVLIQVVAPPDDREGRGKSPQADTPRRSSGAPPHPPGVQDCTTTPDRQGERTRVLLRGDMGVQEALFTRNVGETGVLLTDGVAQSVTPLQPQNITTGVKILLPEDIGSNVIRDVRSAPPVRPEEVRSAPPVRPEEVRSAPPVRPEEMRSAPPVRPEEMRSAPLVRPEEVRSSPPVRPEEMRSAPPVRPEEMRSAPPVRPEEMRSAPLVRPEEVRSSPPVRPEEMRSAPPVRPEEVRSAPLVRPEEMRSAPPVRPEEVRSAPPVRPEEMRSAPPVRPEEMRSAPLVRPEEMRSSPPARPEEMRSAPPVRPEEMRSAPLVRPEEMRSAPPVRPEDERSAPPVRPEEMRSSPPVRPEEMRSAPPVRPDEMSAPPVRSEEVRSAPPVRPEEMRSAPPVRPEEMSAPPVRPEEVRSAPLARPEDTQVAPGLGEAAGSVRSITAVSPTLIAQQEVQQNQDGSSVVGNISQNKVDLNSQSQTSNLPAQPSLGRSSLSPIRVPDPSSPHRNISSKPPLPIPPRSNLYPGPPPREQETSASHETVSLSSFKSKAPAPDTLSYLDSVSLMSGTMESLTLLDDASSLGSDSEINGMPYRRTDKYGFLGGNQFSGNGEAAIPVEIARQRELKWLEMFGNWDKWLTRRSQKVKLRCRKGIPSSLRAKAWQFLSNSHELLMKNPGKFEEMERQPGDPKWLDVIEKDLHRQFPFHEMFAARGGHGQQDLYRILKAYTVYRPEEGYCQAQAPVAAVLLMHMPAEQAFWCLVQICDKYLPGYYSAGLEAIQLDGEIFFALLRRVCPMAYRHLKKFKIDPILYMTEWFMCIFSRTLPWTSVLRVWDMFFCEGVKIVFRVGLVLLRHTLGSVDKLRSCQGMYETMEKLRSLPVHCMQEDFLLPEVSSLPVTDALIERESNTQLRKWRENRGELQYRPSRRLHGAKQIYEEKLRLNPTLSGSRLSLSSLRRPSPPATPVPAVQPESVVVSEGLRPALPSPTSNKAHLGPPREATKKGKEKQREQEKKKEREEREREKKREKEEREERERERRKEREREKQKEKEEKRVQKEREKVESRQKRERKFSFRRKESSPAADSPRNNSGPGAPDSAAAHDTYF